MNKRTFFKIKNSILVVGVILFSFGGAFATESNQTTVIHHHPIAPASNAQSSGQPKAMSVPVPFANVQIINDANQQSETGIAINPTNPLNAVCSANDFACDPEMRFFYTNDGGNTWKNACTPLPSNPYSDNFDASVTYDSRGNVYLCFGDTREISAGDGQNTIYVSKSTNGGVSFETAVPVATNSGAGVSGYGGTQSFYDKMYLTCDANVNSPYRDRLYVTWTNFGINETSNIESWSSDGGATWHGPFTFSGNDPGQCSIPCAGPGGVMYVTWTAGAFGSSADIFIARSDDGGNSFGNPIQVNTSTIKSIGYYDNTYGRLVLPSEDSMRCATFPTIAVDNSTTATAGNVYVAWQGKDPASNMPHIFLATSTNGGAKFGTPQIIDQGYSGFDVFFPALACDPANGDIYIDYFDARNSIGTSIADSYLDMFFSASKDGGKTFTEYPLTPNSTQVSTDYQGTSGGYYWGDYQSLTANNGTVLPCWWETIGNYGNTHIWTAPLRLSPAPVTNISGLSQCGSTSVYLQWTNPTETTLGDTLPTYAIYIYRNGALIDSLSQGTTDFTENNLTNGAEYTYGVVVSAPTTLPTVYTPLSATTTFTIKAGGAATLNPPGSFSLRPVQGGVQAVWQSPAQHTDGSESCDLHAIYFYSDSSSTPSVPLDSMLVSSSDGGTFQSHTIALDTTKIWDMYTTGISLRGSTYTSGDTSNHFSSFAGAPLQNLRFNFDTPAHLWTASNSVGSAWQTSNQVSVSSPNCLVTNPAGKYARHDSSFCQLPPFVVNGLDTTLEFDHILLANTGTAGTLELTTNNGVTWDGIRGYGETNYLPQWHGDSLPVTQCSWVHEDISLLKYCAIGDTLSLRFIFTAGFQQSYGWFIDNINVDSAVPNSIPVRLAPQADFALNQNYPNPFSPTTAISFSIPIAEQARIDVYNALGEHVQTLTDGFMNAGQYAVNFDASQLPQGVYFYTLRAGQFSAIKRMTVIR